MPLKKCTRLLHKYGKGRWKREHKSGENVSADSDLQVEVEVENVVTNDSRLNLQYLPYNTDNTAYLREDKDRDRDQRYRILSRSL